MSLKSEGTQSPLRLIKEGDTAQTLQKTPVMDASVLAKLAEDVIAWNRQPSPSAGADDQTKPRVASLGSLRCGLKIKPKEDQSAGEVRQLFKE